jgi:nickel-type superoxide dismutase maturation protease
MFTAVITGDSMLPVLRAGDWVLVLRTGRVGAGDVVAARDPRAGDRLLVKRAAWRGPDGWWLLGDNPPASTDSRTFGPVADVLGRVVLRYHPGLRWVR